MNGALRFGESAPASSKPYQILQDWVCSAVNAGKPVEHILHLAHEPQLANLPNCADLIREEYAICKAEVDKRAEENRASLEKWKAQQAEKAAAWKLKQAAEPPPARIEKPRPETRTPVRRHKKIQAQAVTSDPPAIREGEQWKRIPEAPDYSFSNYHEVKRNRAVKGSPAGAVIVSSLGKHKHTRWKLVVAPGVRKYFYLHTLMQEIIFD